MKYVVRFGLTLFVLLIIYLLIYRLCFSDEFRRAGSKAEWISISIALACSILCWLKIDNISNSVGGYMTGLGLLGGLIGLFAGLWAPIILMPSNNLAPLLGMLIMAPAGLAAGVIFGHTQWKMKKNSSPH